MYGMGGNQRKHHTFIITRIKDRLSVGKKKSLLVWLLVVLGTEHGHDCQVETAFSSPSVGQQLKPSSAASKFDPVHATFKLSRLEMENW